ncbi:MAG: hypothetical protein J6V44_16060 [Methanobrevibacter sp.]|nr:hypothetical protein [Methanobrevibacter sp.]
MYKLRDLNTMGYKEIIQYIDDFPFLHKQEYSEGSVAYEIVTKNMFPDDDDLPTENTARAVTIDRYGITCRRLMVMNGLIYAREDIEVNNLTELKNYLVEIEDEIKRYSKLYKQAMVDYKLNKMKEDF